MRSEVLSRDSLAFKSCSFVAKTLTTLESNLIMIKIQSTEKAKTNTQHHICIWSSYYLFVCIQDIKVVEELEPRPYQVLLHQA